MQYCIKLKDERNGKASSEVLDEGSTDKDVSLFIDNYVHHLCVLKQFLKLFNKK